MRGESYIQQECVRWFRLQYREFEKLLFATPNQALRSPRNASRMKAEGMVAGVADLVLLVSRGGYNALCIEVKTEKGRQSPSQREWQQAVEKHGSKYVIVRSVDQFIELINNYLK